VGLITVVASMVIAACGHSEMPKAMSDKDYVRSVQDRTSSACAKVANAPLPGNGGTTNGPSVEMEGNADGTVYLPFWAMGSSLTFATSDSTFKSLVCVVQKEVPVGNYVDESGRNFQAKRQDWVVRVLSWPSGDVVAGREFQGGDPPQNCTTVGGSTDTCEGSTPDAEPNDWIKTVIIS
jgi:hypothetical protein